MIWAPASARPAATSRIVGCSINTVTKLLLDVGEACAAYQDEHLRDLSCKTIEADEIWSFVYSKERNVPKELRGQFGIGDVWTWTALDADSKLIVSWYVGGRANEDAAAFMTDLSERLSGRIQLTTDGHGAYPNAVGLAFRHNIDFAQLIEQYASPREEQARYSPAVCTGARVRVDRGDPDPARISTSYVERQNLTMRMGMRRFTRLTNGFSKKLDNHMAAIAIDFMHYNFAPPAQEPVARPGGRPRDQADPGDGRRDRRPHLDRRGHRGTGGVGFHHGRAPELSTLAVGHAVATDCSLGQRQA